jgi:hypothetical protein
MIMSQWRMKMMMQTAVTVFIKFPRKHMKISLGDSNAELSRDVFE